MTVLMALMAWPLQYINSVVSRVRAVMPETEEDIESMSSAKAAPRILMLDAVVYGSARRAIRRFSAEMTAM